MLKAWKRAVVPNPHNLRTGKVAYSLSECASYYAVRETEDTPLSGCLLQCEDNFFFTKNCL